MLSITLSSCSCTRLLDVVLMPRKFLNCRANSKLVYILPHRSQMLAVCQKLIDHSKAICFQHWTGKHAATPILPSVLDGRMTVLRVSMQANPTIITEAARHTVQALMLQDSNFKSGCTCATMKTTATADVKPLITERLRKFTYMGHPLNIIAW